MFIIIDDAMWRTDFEPFDDMEMLTSHSNLCVVRTFKLLPTLMFMQEKGWRLRDLQPDDEEGIEREILTFYKPKEWNQNKRT